MATYEIRLTSHKLNDAPAQKCRTPEEIARYLADNCYDPDEMWREKAFAVFLDRNNDILGHFLLSVGGTDSTVIDIKVLAKAALDVMASAVVLSHNHPSMSPIPSKHDIEMTEKAKRGLAILDIKLLDHIVLGDETFFTFSEERIIAMPERNPREKTSQPS